MIRNVEAALPLCRELEAWCRAESLPYLRADDLAEAGYLSEGQRAWVQQFVERWEALKAAERVTQGVQDMTQPSLDASNAVGASNESSSVDFEWHYAPMTGGLMRKRSGEVEFERVASWEERHRLMDEFLAKCQRSELKVARTETYGHALFNGHSGRVDVYI